MTEYQGNSDKLKKDTPVTPEKNLAKVVTGDVVVQKPGVATRFKQIFFGGDMHTAREYVLAEVVLPALRNLAWEAISKGSDRLIYGDRIRRRPPGASGYGPRIQYNSPVIRQEPRGNLPDRPAAAAWSQNAVGTQQHTYIVALKEDAEEVVERMIDVVNQYEVVSVADLYELLGLPMSPIDQKWGWNNMTTVDVRQVREGWRITFPKPEEIS